MAKILLVEDDPLMLAVLTMSLRQAGHEVVTASTVQHARQHLGQGAFDALVSDLTLPDADGDALPSLCSIPAIAMSGHDGYEARQRSQRAGFVAHLAKPFELEQLLTALQAVIVGRANGGCG